ncbi:hypothetical protein ACW2QC_07400 [Virgibacillus sp. FSP13]|uniref:hypothetical protein n=1 Tax=Lentibacillus sp. Marseille-P4043 TaxID=2040293 RepID=UPI000D0B52A9|nr:hypothetical protein [Lentibacillus sp. Marseille-P4043]
MIFYHFSNENINVLEPKLGPRRHSSEDSSIVNKPVIFLKANANIMFFDGKPSLFRYTVDINTLDKNLYRDMSMDHDYEIMKSLDPTNATIDNAGVYYYLDNIKPIKKEQWNGEFYE